MANANPPDKVDNGKAPGHWNVDAPDTNAHGQQIGHGTEQDHDQEKGQPKANPPPQWRATAERNGADFIGDRGVSVAGLEDGGARRLFLLTVDVRSVLAHEAILASVKARRAVPGWGCAGVPGTSCVAGYSTPLTGRSSTVWP